MSVLGEDKLSSDGARDQPAIRVGEARKTKKVKTFGHLLTIHFGDTGESNGGDKDPCVKWQDFIVVKGSTKGDSEATSRGCITKHSWSMA